MKELKCIVYSNNPKIENWQFNMEKYRLVHSSFPVEPKVFLFGRDHVDPIFIYRAIWENRIIERYFRKRDSTGTNLPFDPGNNNGNADW